jgi:hypothetical protein
MRAYFVFEKFSEESDPITDLEIGIGTFDNPKPLMILRSKVELEIKNHMLHHVWILLTGADKWVNTIDKKQYIIITKVKKIFDEEGEKQKKYGNYYRIEYVLASKDINTAIQYRQNLVKNRDDHDNHFLATPDILKKYFDIANPYANKN